MNPYPLPQIDATPSRPTAASAWASWAGPTCFSRWASPYDSQEATDLGNQLMAFVKEKSTISRRSLPRKRGPFPNWDHSIYKKSPADA